MQGCGLIRGYKLETNMADANPKTKRAQLVTLVNRKSGASIETIQVKLAWQPHTIRAEISRLRKRGLVVTCTPSPKGSVYRAVARSDV